MTIDEIIQALERVIENFKEKNSRIEALSWPLIIPSGKKGVDWSTKGGYFYSEKHDADWCCLCDEWLESGCGDKECDMCSRPDKPSQAGEVCGQVIEFRRKV